MKAMVSMAVAVALQVSASVAGAQALDVDIMNDLTPAQQQQVRAGITVTVTNPIVPIPNHWTVTYYRSIGSTLSNADAFGATAVYADYEAQPDYQFPYLLDYMIQAGTGTAAVKGLVTTPDPAGNPVLGHQVNAVFRTGDPANPLYSATYHGTDLPAPTAAFLASFGAVDLQRDAVTGVAVMRYTANLIPSPAIAGNAAIKTALIANGNEVVQLHARKMRNGATPSQLKALRIMLNGGMQ